MGYIIIVKKETVRESKVCPATKLWMKIHDRSPNERYEEVKEYDWVPNPNQEIRTEYSKDTVEIYNQTVETLDIVAVINAVNSKDQ